MAVRWLLWAAAGVAAAGVARGTGVVGTGRCSSGCSAVPEDLWPYCCESHNTCCQEFADSCMNDCLPRIHTGDVSVVEERPGLCCALYNLCCFRETFRITSFSRPETQQPVSFPFVHRFHTGISQLQRKNEEIQSQRRFPEQSAQVHTPATSSRLEVQAPKRPRPAQPPRDLKRPEVQPPRDLKRPEVQPPRGLKRPEVQPPRDLKRPEIQPPRGLKRPEVQSPRGLKRPEIPQALKDILSGGEEQRNPPESKNQGREIQQELKEMSSNDGTRDSLIEMRKPSRPNIPSLDIRVEEPTVVLGSSDDPEESLGPRRPAIRPVSNREEGSRRITESQQRPKVAKRLRRPIQRGSESDVEQGRREQTGRLRSSSTAERQRSSTTAGGQRSSAGRPRANKVNGREQPEQGARRRPSQQQGRETQSRAQTVTGQVEEERTRPQAIPLTPKEAHIATFDLNQGVSDRVEEPLFEQTLDLEGQIADTEPFLATYVSAFPVTDLLDEPNTAQIDVEEIKMTKMERNLESEPLEQNPKKMKMEGDQMQEKGPEAPQMTKDMDMDSPAETDRLTAQSNVDIESQHNQNPFIDIDEQTLTQLDMEMEKQEMAVLPPRNQEAGTLRQSAPAAGDQRRPDARTSGVRTQTQTRESRTFQGRTRANTDSTRSRPSGGRGSQAQGSSRGGTSAVRGRSEAGTRSSSRGRSRAQSRSSTRGGERGAQDAAQTSRRLRSR